MLFVGDVSTAIANTATRSSPLLVATITGSTITVSPSSVTAGALTIKVLNRSTVPRDFRIGSKRTAVIGSGASTLMDVVLVAGVHPFSSTAPGHGSRLTGLLNVVQPCSTPVATTVRVAVAQSAGGLTVSQTSIPCGSVTFIVSNTGSMVDRVDVFEVNQPTAQASTDELSPGQTESLTIEFQARGIAFCQSVDYPPPEPEYGDFNEIAKLAIT
jgi:hypothetical protein